MNEKSIYHLALRYAEYHRITMTRVSSLVYGSGSLFSRIKKDKSITIYTYNKVLQWFSDHWSADLVWPADIPRPCPNPHAAPVNHRRGRRAQGERQDNRRSILNCPASPQSRRQSPSESIPVGPHPTAKTRPVTPRAVAQFGRDQVNKVWARYVAQNKAPRPGSRALDVLVSMNEELGCDLVPVLAERQARQAARVESARAFLAASNNPLAREIAPLLS